MYFKTDLDAPLGRVIAIDTRKPERKNVKEIIPQAKDKLSGVSLVGNLFICSYLKDARTLVKTYDTAGKFVRDVESAGHRQCGRLRRQTHRQRDVLHLLQLRHAAEQLSLRPRDRQEPAAAQPPR